MRICVISSTVFSVPLLNYGGLEQIAYQQAKGLAALGHEVSLVAPQGSYCPNVTVIPTGPPGHWDEKTAYGGYWQELLKFDAIIDHSWCKWSYVLKMEGRLQAPVLGAMHAPVNSMYQSLPQLEKPCFVCISKDQANHFEALYSKPAKVCYNGVDLDFYKPTGVPRTNRFLFLARFSSIKGADLAIDACKAAGVGLDLIGDTTITNEPDYFNQCKAKCDGQQIRMVGPASRSETIHWFSQAHCMLHPNRIFREPYGLAPVEAQACELPVVSWNFGAMRETIKHGETGFLVTSLQGMIDVIKSDATNTIKRSYCREWVYSQFTEQHMIARIAELCQEAVEGGEW